VLGARVLGVGLDAIEVPLRLRPFDLELGNERQPLPVSKRDHDRPLGGEEVEAGEVLDVRLIEEDDSAEPARSGVLEQRAAALRELGPGDAGRLHGSDDIGPFRPGCR
jgi:hypothetical protein